VLKAQRVHKKWSEPRSTLLETSALARKVLFRSSRFGLHIRPWSFAAQTL
jgi:hypothetical protein